ncbi:hypothetical protein AAFX24_17450 [Vibrio mediterranei]
MLITNEQEYQEAVKHLQELGECPVNDIFGNDMDELIQAIEEWENTQQRK